MVMVMERLQSWLKETNVDCWQETGNEQQSPMSKVTLCHLNVNIYFWGDFAELT